MTYPKMQIATLRKIYMENEGHCNYCFVECWVEIEVSLGFACLQKRFLQISKLVFANIYRLSLEYDKFCRPYYIHAN